MEAPAINTDSKIISVRKSKTKLVIGNRKGTVRKSIIEKAIREVYAKLGIEFQ